MPESIVAASDTTLSNSFFTATKQVCVVTRDYRKTLAGMVKLGIGPWSVYTFANPDVTNTTYMGKPAEFSMKICLAFTGDMMWEIVQPLTGPTIYKDFLERHGEGIHHLAVHCGDMSFEDQKAEFERRGYRCIQSGVWKERVPFAYFDTEGDTTTTVEIFDIPGDFALPEPEEVYPS